MAVRKKTNKTSSNSPGIGCMFWLAFIILLIGLFLFNRSVISNVLQKTGFAEKFLSGPKTDTSKPAPDAPAPSPVPAPVAAPVAAPAANGTKPAETVATPVVPPTEAVKPTPKEPVSETKTVPAKPAEKPAAVSVPANKPVEQKAPPARNRTLWFVRIDDDGVIARVKTTRALPVSDSPLFDAISALTAGPSAAESKKGNSSLIPAGTKLLSAVVRGSTAYLSFNEDFQFNSFGIEGYAAQLRQIIWTATEFESVEDVQILIEGRRVDYLGSEGIWIGSPIGRESL